MIDCVVSLTSWKGRIYDPAFPLVLFRLINQQTNFTYKVVLSLSEEEFPNKDADIPYNVRQLQASDRFELCWSYSNTRALKNYYPVKRKYKNVPIIVVGDDTIYSKHLVQIMMSEHLRTPTQALGNDLWYWDAKDYSIPILCKVRLFPPNCMFNLCEDYFKVYFNNLENDVFYGIALKLNNTMCRKVDDQMIDIPGVFGQSVSLSNEYTQQKNDPKAMCHRFLNEHPELAILIT
jgi:hypothetical protein